MKGLFKKVTAVAAVLTLMAGTLSVSAADNTSAGYIPNTADVNLDGANECSLECVINSSFQITIPKNIILDGINGEAYYEVNVQGDIAGNQIIHVIPDETFDMHESGGKADIEATVTQPVVNFVVAETSTDDTIGSIAAENGASANGLVAAPITAGIWNGSFMFNVSLSGEVLTAAEEIERNQEILASAYVRIANKAEEVTELEADEATAIVMLADIYAEAVNDSSITVSIVNTECNGSKLDYSVRIQKGKQSITASGLSVELKAAEIEYVDFALKASNYQMAGITREGNVVIPSTFEYEGVKYKVTSIGESAFESCTSLTSITIPDSVKTIGKNAFNYCTNLASINIPDSVTTIDNGAFFFCTDLASINIPDSVTAIGENAFFGCGRLTEITIPDSVTTIDYDAFCGCNNLTTIYYNGTATGAPWGATKAQILPY